MNDEVLADHTSQYAHSTKSWNGYGSDGDVADREINPPPRRPSEASSIRNFLDRPAVIPVRAPTPPDPFYSNFFKQDTPPDTPSRVEDHKGEEKAKWTRQLRQKVQKMLAKRKKA
ncbi:hypothetical protein PAXINDRAFT_170995 [Paxillus involutus ATCC 200175]|uniref:Uncharacterized protein n=1 Tax=Paxillus involutus ATCC 200175 TaxID=664439 RepID=A0A0C9TB40_PAXIN|nr:hypothetical protein PAXINDRAFT_170995 [Paxillus involutus ATCC 200175]